MINSHFNKLYKNSELGSLFLIMVGLILLSACQPKSAEPELLVFTGPIMGTEFRISVVADSEHDYQELNSEILGVMGRVNKSMSTYLEGSEISQFNRLSANKSFQISGDFAKVMTEAQRVSTISDGAFDVTLGQVINLWGFGPEGKITKQPSSGELKKLIKKVGYQKVLIENQTLTKTVDGVSLSFSAIAKGFAVDKVAESLNALGLKQYLVNIGGELRASGTKIDGSEWKVGIEKPHVLGGVQEVISLVNQSIATSGDYRNYHILDEQYFSHTIDAKTLKPVYHKLALVSVVHKSAMTADALATAMMAMGDLKALEFAQKENLAVYMIVRGEQRDDYHIKMSELFRLKLQ